MTVRPTVLGGILIAIIVLVVGCALLIWRAANRIGEFIDIAKQLLVLFQHNFGKKTERTDADNESTGPIDVPDTKPTPYKRGRHSAQ